MKLDFGIKITNLLTDKPFAVMDKPEIRGGQDGQTVLEKGTAGANGDAGRLIEYIIGA